MADIDLNLASAAGAVQVKHGPSKLALLGTGKSAAGKAVPASGTVPVVAANAGAHGRIMVGAKKKYAAPKLAGRKATYRYGGKRVVMRPVGVIRSPVRVAWFSACGAVFVLLAVLVPLYVRDAFTLAVCVGSLIFGGWVIISSLRSGVSVRDGQIVVREPGRRSHIIDNPLNMEIVESSTASAIPLPIVTIRVHERLRSTDLDTISVLRWMPRSDQIMRSRMARIEQVLKP